MILTSVLFPAPFSPRTAWISPVRTSQVTPSSAWVAPKRFEIRRATNPLLEVMRLPVATEPTGARPPDGPDLRLVSCSR